MDTPFEPKRIKARAIDWDQIQAEFIRARGTHAASSTPNTWPQPTRCQKTKEPLLSRSHPYTVRAQWRTAKTNMAPLRGWAARGLRLIGRAPVGHWNTMTFVAALRHNGIVAPWVIDGPINGETFRTYVEQVLVPELHEGDIVILDILGSHKAPAIRHAIRAAGARLLFLPAYSPDLNPIKQVFAKLKHLLRKAAERSREAVWRRVGDLFELLTPQECENYLRNSGYGSV